MRFRKSFRQSKIVIDSQNELYYLHTMNPKQAFVKQFGECGEILNQDIWLEKFGCFYLGWIACAESSPAFECVSSICKKCNLAIPELQMDHHRLHCTKTIS